MTSNADPASRSLLVPQAVALTRRMKSALGLLCLAACASKAPPPANVQAADPERRALTPDIVLATIRGNYLGGVQRCYRRYLKRDEEAHGRVMVSFTVDPNGRARNCEAHGI